LGLILAHVPGLTLHHRAVVDLDFWLNLAATWACPAQLAQVWWGYVIVLGSLSRRKQPALAVL